MRHNEKIPDDQFREATGADPHKWEVVLYDATDTEAGRELR